MWGGGATCEGEWGRSERRRHPGAALRHGGVRSRRALRGGLIVAGEGEVRARAGLPSALRGVSIAGRLRRVAFATVSSSALVQPSRIRRESHCLRQGQVG